MENPIVRPNLLFRPLLTAGIIIIAFGILCIWIGSSINLQEEGEGFMIIGWRFLIAGLVSIVIAYITRYFVFISAYIRYISKQIHYRRDPKQNKFRDWYKP
jgi:hypothetical protein